MRTTKPHRVRTSALQGRLTQRRSFLASRRPEARHARAGVAPLERVMRRSAIRSHAAFHLHLQLPARLASVVERHTERRIVQPAAGPQRSMQVRIMRSLMPVLRHELLQRLAERPIERRTVPGAAAPAPQLAAAARVGQRQAAPRVETVMLRTQPTGANAAAAAVAATGASLAAASPRPGTTQAPSTPSASPAAPLVLPAREMSRLTDHVIRQLDHRVLSWQERTGRV